ncbi:MAG: DUF6036 family nucleotidyltransferase [Acidobacteriota bacterium]
MRAQVNAAKIRRLLRELGRSARGPGRIYLTGGATALLEGWRDTTVDVDIKLDPEPPGIFAAIHRLKQELDVNIELAAPDQFLPALSDWQARSSYVERHGQVDFYHYDFRAQALSKLARGMERDIADVRAMVARGLVRRDDLADALEEILPGLIRYPSLDADAFARRVQEFLEQDDV